MEQTLTNGHPLRSELTSLPYLSLVYIVIDPFEKSSAFDNTPLMRMKPVPVSDLHR